MEGVSKAIEDDINGTNDYRPSDMIPSIPIPPSSTACNWFGPIWHFIRVPHQENMNVTRVTRSSNARSPSDS
jgi:hypothetical protein